VEPAHLNTPEATSAVSRATAWPDPTDAPDATDSPDSPDATHDTAPPEPVDIYGDGPFDCDFVPPEDLTGAEPSFRQTTVRVQDAPTTAQLSEGGREVLEDGNLNPNSLQSELLAFEVLHRCEGVSLIYTEGEVPYTNPDGKKTDLVVTWDQARIGVSVTRAVGFPPDDPWGVDKATTLLTDKLEDVRRSSDNVREDEAWAKQILFVAAYAPEHGDSLWQAWQALDPEVTGDIAVVVSITDGDDDFIYFR